MDVPSGAHSTWTVCLLAAGATAWLGYASGLFDEVSPIAIVATLAPYLVLALLSLACRHRPAGLGMLFALAVLMSGYGLFFFFNDWYWPQPTNPNPWRVMMIPVVIVPQWAVVGLAVMSLLVYHLWSTHSSAARGIE